MILVGTIRPKQSIFLEEEKKEKHKQIESGLNRLVSQGLHSRDFRDPEPSNPGSLQEHGASPQHRRP